MARPAPGPVAARRGVLAIARPGEAAADQIGLWRLDLEQPLAVEGAQRDRVELEGPLLKAMFTGLVIDLLATGDRKRLRAALDLGLDGLDALLDTLLDTP